MAYNTFPSYNTYGTAYPVNSYQQQYSQAVQPYVGQTNNSYAAQQQPIGIVWVDGEVGAKAYQLPSNWPVNAPMPLWDTNDTIIYLKSTNQMGMPASRSERGGFIYRIFDKLTYYPPTTRNFG